MPLESAKLVKVVGEGFESIGDGIKEVGSKLRNVGLDLQKDVDKNLPTSTSLNRIHSGVTDTLARLADSIEVLKQAQAVLEELVRIEEEELRKQEKSTS